MANLQASSLLSSSSFASLRDIKASNYYLHHHTPNLKKTHLSIPSKLPNTEIIHEFNRRTALQNLTTSSTQIELMKPINARNNEGASNSVAVKEIYAIMEAVADRSEMHKNIGAQRDNWNHLLLSSVNGITITAATMAGLAALSGGGAGGAPFLALKLSSSLLYIAATGILMVMNKIQPSQLAEEQRNAARLFKQLHTQIKTTLHLRNPTSNDVNNSMEKVLALDKAYPLPLIGTMIEKFPASVEPAVWWPKQLKSTNHEEEKKMSVKKGERNNGWNEKLEEEMKGIVGVLKRKDSAEYVRLSRVVLKVNKILAICGPLFTVAAAIGSAFMGNGRSWAVILGVVFGALATAVNTLEHGGQVGMVFEMYRSSAGFFKLMEEEIESTLKDEETDKRENGELYEVKVALQLGRSLSALRNLASASSSSSLPRSREVEEEFASKLF